MAKDPYRYFRIEAQELLDGLGQGLLELEKGPDIEVMKRLLRHAHTFKGASRVVKRTDIGDLAHRIEDLLSPHRDTGGPVARGTIDGALELLDRIRQLVIALGTVSAAEPAPARPELVPNQQQTIRIAVRDLDALIESAHEAHMAASSLGREGARLEQVRSLARELLADLPPHAPGRLAGNLERLVDELDQAQRTMLERVDQTLGELGELRAAASELRLVPAQVLMGDLERVVRDAARALDKDVELRATGGETHIDAHVLTGLRNALVHVVRNSVAHGIEDRAGRTQAGKPATGGIDISIERRGHRVLLVCRDDGRGLDLELVRAAAIERGLVSPSAATQMDERGLGQLLLRGGLSTSRSVSTVSGRGVGLDAVRHAIESLEGEISLHSVPGKGTTVELLVPLSLSAMPTLALQLDDLAVLVPLDSVRRTLRVSTGDITRDAQGERLVVDGRVIPFLRLRRALGRPVRARSGLSNMQSAVVIEAEGRLAAVGVDRLGAVRSVVMRAIPEPAAPAAIVAGAALDDDGVPQLVLAPPALIRLASDSVPLGDEPAPRALPPLLVVDDSLTTRMLEQSILESAGYEVDLAVSGEEGLEKARTRRYGAFVVDVEMPGMDGFELLARLRSDPELHDIPAILVTSRAAPEDKRRGKEVGARAYIVKSEFDQAELLQTIRRLIG
jgi:two-component system chemotaxis sensor kinase CheA